MTLAQKLIKLSKNMNDDMLFAEYLIFKNNKDPQKLVDEFIKDNKITLEELSK